MSAFEPIAIIGQGCVLPGAHSPEALWQAVACAADLTGTATSDDWGIDIARVTATPGADTTDRCWNHRGGYVRGFEQVFDPDRFQMDREWVAGLDSGVQWCLHAAREALLSAGMEPFSRARDDVGVILGNLAYAPRSMQDYTARYWLSQNQTHPDGAPPPFTGNAPADLAAIPAPAPQRFFSAAAPAQLTARAIGAGGGALCLDAACASSLYAIKLACERLQDGKARLMLAGALNHADDLYLHIGFTALQALSRVGVARPFDQRADGLVPGAGAAVVVLKRLTDARKDGDNVLGVIRGIGLSNDGRSGGFLSPSPEGQAAAISRAYGQCDISPEQISYLECHATGTSAGDATEIDSIRRVFGTRSDLALASLKGNIGHLITAAGAAGLIRLLGAMRHGELAASINVDAPIEALSGSDLRLLRERETWSDQQPRIAGLNAFGFGGNNAHMIVQQRLEPTLWPVPTADRRSPASDTPSNTSNGPDDTVVITGIAVRTAEIDSSEGLLRALLSPAARADDLTISSIDVPLPKLGFPPSDLDHTLGQQLLIMQLVRDLLSNAGKIDPAATSILVGMGTDPNTTRYATRTRLAEWLMHWREHGLPCDDSWFEQAKEAISPGLNAAGVLGTMPNIPANRSNHQLDLRGPSYTVAAEELGGVHSLQIAARSLLAGDIDAAVVGAVDLCRDDLYQHALQQALGEQYENLELRSADAAVALMLKRKSDAARDGDTIIAELAAVGQASGAETGDPASPPSQQPEAYPWAQSQTDLVRERLGHCHAAFGLINVASAALMLQHGLKFDQHSGQPGPDLSSGRRSWAMRLSSLGVNGGGQQQVNCELRAPAQQRALTPAATQRLYRFAGADIDSLREALQAKREADTGDCRLAIIAADGTDFERKRSQALQRLASADREADKNGPAGTGVKRLLSGVYLAREAIGGELGFAFTGAASAYPGMGRELLMALPQSVQATLQRFPVLANSQSWLDESMPAPDSEFAVLQGCSLLSQVHAHITQDLLKLKPQAMLGVSSGETNSVFAAGAWRDMGAMFAEIDASQMYPRWISGHYQAAREALGLKPPIEWQAFRVIAPAEKLSDLLAEESRVFLTMINASRDCVIGGERDALAKIMPQIEALASAVIPLGHDIIAHCPVLRCWQEPWRKIHSRETVPLPNLRFYSNASGGSYQAEKEAIADALTHQAIDAVDFRRVVEAAYADGVRVFVEHGPRPLCSQWVSATLGQRPHVSVHLDRPGAGVTPLFEAVAQLWCAGVAVDYKVLETMNGNDPTRNVQTPSAAATRTVPAHPPAIQWPALPSGGNTADTPSDASMPNAPSLSSALHPAIGDDEATLAAIDSALSVAPQPSYAMPQRVPDEPATGEPVSAAGIADLRATTEDIASAVATPVANRQAPDRNEAPLPPEADVALLVGRMHQQLMHSHQQYLSLQQGAAQQLLDASVAFSQSPEGSANTAPSIGASVSVSATSVAATPNVSGAEAPPPLADTVSAAAPASGSATLMAAPALDTHTGDSVSLREPVRDPVHRPNPPSAADTRIARTEPASVTESALPSAPKVPAKAPATVAKLTLPDSAPQDEHFPGPKFDRGQLEILADGKISEILGALFEQQDDFQCQVRMPCPPLLLADRVLGIDATPGAMETSGSIWTETDVSADAWYLHHGHMPAGIMIESGQADLLLISWMGADFENRGERVYRLLGCELTYRAGLPAIDDTLRYDIHVDGYAKQGDVRLFFFHYNCEIEGQRRLEVRHGQAGFFTYDELANSAGIIWDAASEAPRAELAVDTPPQPTTRQHFDPSEVKAFADGDLVTCFGPGFEPGCCHQRTPTIAAGKMQLFDRVTELDHRGGPWGRGYIRAELDILPDHWFFDGHFKNDPCMPGTLMFEGGMQVMAFYLTSLGYTLTRDGWRFEPVKDEAFKLLCRSQLIPGARQLVCELFVHGVEGGATPRLRVDMLCSVDGRKAFLGQSVGIELVPGWPLESRRHMLPTQASEDVARDEQFPFDERAMVACAWGRPSQAFGPHYARHDGPRRGPRLPGYPYHFISRVVDVQATPRAMTSGGRATVEYDVPADAWYFAENSQPTMPFPVLLEAALQPCGWLATYIGGGFQGDTELFFRNLDGTATWHRDVLPDAGKLRTEVENTSVSQVGSMTIVGFKVLTSQGAEPVYEMDTVFGFFPEAALADQAGLPATEDELRDIQAQGSVMRPLRQRDARFFQRSLRLPGPMLFLLDRITDLQSGTADGSAGHVRAEMDVDPNAWYFKSHFYGDPVQPGSLGLEMMLQCLQYFAIDQDLGSDLSQPRFEAVARPHNWSYRGQVLPQNKRVICDLEVTSIERAAGRITICANATLWADGTKIYKAEQLSLAIVDAEPAAGHAADLALDRGRDPWINDHCPTWTVPALPMTCMLDQLAAAAAQRSPGKQVIGMKDVRASRWLAFNEPVRYLRCWARSVSAGVTEANLLAWEKSGQYEEVAQGNILLGEQYLFAPAAWPALAAAEEVPLPYASGSLFHGPAFQGMRSLKLSAKGSSARVDAGHSSVPVGALNPGFLDACLHGIPHDNLRLWFPELDAESAAYPLLILAAAFYGPTPQHGLYRVEARPQGIHSTWRLPHISLQIIDADGMLWAEMELIEAVLPKGPLGSLDPMRRRAFISEHQYQDGAHLSVHDGAHSALSVEQLRASNWLPGTLQQIYRSEAEDEAKLARDIVVKEHLGAQHQLHPSQVLIEETESQTEARLAENLLLTTPLSIIDDGSQVRASSQPARLNLEPVKNYWRQQLDKAEGLEEDLFLSLACRFVSSIKCSDIELLASERQRGVLFLANHQVGVESMLFSILMGGFMRRNIVTLAKKEHRDSWIGRLLQALFADSPQAPDLLQLLDRDDPRDVLKQMTSALQRVAAGQQSLLVHADGTRSLRAGEPLSTVSTALIGTAVAADVDIIPVAFRGGLSVNAVEQRLEFPVGFGKQQFVLGPRITSAALRSLTAPEQKTTVLAAINSLLSDDQPSAPDSASEAFGEAVGKRLAERAIDPVQAVLWLSLNQSALPLSDETQRLIQLAENPAKRGRQQNDERWLRNVAETVFGR